MSHTVGLVACGKSKLTTPAPARDLYIGPLFRKASAYAEATYNEWWVLSARHYIVRPDTVLEPYDHTMADKDREQREAWARTVDMRLRCAGDDSFAGLAARKKAGEQ